MTPTQLAALYERPGFPETGRELLAVAGLTAAAALITAWPGQNWPTPAVVGGGSKRGKVRWAQLSELVGEEAATRIVRHYRGCLMYIPSCEAASKGHLAEIIKKEYDQLTSAASGYSHRDALFEIGLKYKLTGRSIERIVNRPSSAGSGCQIALF